MNADTLASRSGPTAAVCLLQGFRLLGRPGIRRLVFAPLALNVLIYGSALWVSVHFFSQFVAWLLPAWLGFLQWLLWPLFAVAFLALVGFSFTLLAAVLGAPFYSVLAEKLLVADGLIEPGQGSGLSIGQSILIELRRVGAYVGRSLPLLLLFLIPGVNVLAPFVWMAFSAWFLARGFFAYPLDALGLDYAGQERELRKIRAGGLIFGMLVQLASSLPVLNVLVPPAAVLGASACVAARSRNRQIAADR